MQNKIVKMKTFKRTAQCSINDLKSVFRSQGSQEVTLSVTMLFPKPKNIICLTLNNPRIYKSLFKYNRIFNTHWI